MSKDKYDRQIRLWGEGQILISSSQILCLNSDSTAAEILKNLILSGISEVTVVDNTLISNKDLELNFFVGNEDLNKPRSEVILKNLKELNPDVKVNAINDAIDNYINNLNSEINFDVIISSNLNDSLNTKLYELCEKNNKRLFIIKNNGLYNMIKIFENFHGNMKLRLLENPISDFRLSCPWKELIDFSNQFDFEKMNEIDYTHVPYFIILIKSLLIYRKQKNNDSSNPKTKDEKEEFKNIIKSLQKENVISDNFDEALSYYYYCNADKNNLIDYKLDFIFKTLEDYKLEDLLSKSNDIMKIFFIYFTSLKKYYLINKTLPLCGNIPDMTSSTKNFIELKRIYNAKAEKDREELKKIINEVLMENEFENKDKITNKINNNSTDEIDIIDILNKNWPQASLFIYPNYKEEEKGKNLSEEEFDEDFKKINFIYYLLFRASEKFFEKNKRYPGTEEDFEKDVPELEELLKNEVNLLEIKPFEDINNYLNKDYVYEFCRMGKSYVPPCVSIIASIASQEIIKMITYQFETVNNTIIYDGVGVNLSIFKI